MNKINTLVYKDNQLIEASYKLTLMEQRLILYCISKINPNEPQQKQDIRVQDFLVKFPDLDPKSIYAQLKLAIDAISERWITVKKPRSVKQFRWIQSKEYFTDLGMATLTFSNDVMPYLCQLEQQFTKYQLRNVSGFKHTYSIRLYELLTQYRDFKKRSITIKDFRTMLDLGEKYSTMVNLKTRVLEPSIIEINNKSDLNISYTQKKKGREIYSFEFVIEPKEKPDIEKKELNKSLAKKHLNQIKEKLKI